MTNRVAEWLADASEFPTELDMALGAVAAFGMIGSIFAREPAAKWMFRVGAVSFIPFARRAINSEGSIETIRFADSVPSIPSD